MHPVGCREGGGVGGAHARSRAESAASAPTSCAAAATPPALCLLCWVHAAAWLGNFSADRIRGRPASDSYCLRKRVGGAQGLHLRWCPCRSSRGAAPSRSARRRQAQGCSAAGVRVERVARKRKGRTAAHSRRRARRTGHRCICRRLRRAARAAMRDALRGAHAVQVRAGTRPGIPCSGCSCQCLLRRRCSSASAHGHQRSSRPRHRQQQRRRPQQQQHPTQLTTEPHLGSSALAAALVPTTTAQPRGPHSAGLHALPLAWLATPAVPPIAHRRPHSQHRRWAPADALPLPPGPACACRLPGRPRRAAPCVPCRSRICRRADRRHTQRSRLKDRRCAARGVPVSRMRRRLGADVVAGSRKANQFASAAPWPLNTPTDPQTSGRHPSLLHLPPPCSFLTPHHGGHHRGDLFGLHVRPAGCFAPPRLS